MRSFYIAVDLGATNVRVALSKDYTIIAKLSETTDKIHNEEGVSNQIIRMIKTLMHNSGIKEVRSIGIGSIGPIDIKSGTIVKTPNLPFYRVPLVDPLSQIFRVPVNLLRDCSAGALGEHIFGAGKGLKNIVYLTLSTGIGGGAVIDGHLLTGKDGNAVEVGHLTINPKSTLLCGCGCHGHWEAYTSGNNLHNYVSLLLNQCDETQKSELYLTPESLFRAAKVGDTTALWLVKKIGEVNAVGFADVINSYDPDIISIGGSIALNNPHLVISPIEKNIPNYTINRVPPLVLTPLKDEAVLYGALIQARKASET